MDAASLNPAQRYGLLLALVDRRDWVGRLRERMDAAGWPPDDRFYATVAGAREALHAAVVALAESAPAEDPGPPGPPEQTWRAAVAGRSQPDLPPTSPASPPAATPGAATGGGAGSC
jgi:hypothetical protein